jgi:hypothetical protein
MRYWRLDEFDVKHTANEHALYKLRVLILRKQSAYMHSKAWRCRARVIVARSPSWTTLRQQQSFSRTLLSQQPNTTNFSTPTK